jgi:uncharacterized protein YutE (UPF0331/DUF86 family)
MTDADLVAKKLARIETCVSELRRLADADRIATDVVQQRFVEHTLQIAIQAALDVASHIASDERLGEPETNRDLFVILARGGYLPAALLPSLERMAGFRNVLVHGYDEVDLRVVRTVVEHHLGDLEQFAAAVRAKLG